MKYFMLDIETMGTDFERDDIIQIALLELNQNAEGLYAPGRAYERNLFTAQKPQNDWIANQHKDKLEVCRKLPWLSAPWIRADVRQFFKNCGVEEPAMLMGLNATTFDIPYMVAKGFLQKPSQDKNNKLVGDYHYRIYELKGAYNLAQDVLGIDSKTLFARAGLACPEIQLPEGKTHEALYDCYLQTKVLNGMIRLLRNARAA